MLIGGIVTTIGLAVVSQGQPLIDNLTEFFNLAHAAPRSLGKYVSALGTTGGFAVCWRRSFETKRLAC